MPPKAQPYSKPKPADPISLARRELAVEASYALRMLGLKIHRPGGNPELIAELFRNAGLEGPFVDDLLREFQALADK